jgi:hypothetical protein
MYEIYREILLTLVNTRTTRRKRMRRRRRGKGRRKQKNIKMETFLLVEIC